MKKYILSLDQGTTSSRAVLFDKNREIVGIAQRETAQIFPQPGWVEQDPMEILSTQVAVAYEVLTKCSASPSEIAAVGIANQRETTIVWEKRTGRPVCNAIVWQCRRTTAICEALIKKGLSGYIKKTTGLVPDAYFSATKIKWILENVKNARKRAQDGELLFGTVDSWLIYNLTGKKVHATDYTNASRTMLFDIHRLEWDETLLRELDIPDAMLPEVRGSGDYYGEFLMDGVKIPVLGVAGDQQSALFGQGCFFEGSIKNTYGTGCFLLANTGEKAVESKNGLLTTVACSLTGGATYALEGSVFVGGAAVQWLRDGLGILRAAPESEELAKKAGGNGGVYLVPAFTGLGAPYWDMYARGGILGLTRGVNHCHIARAALESIAYQTKDVLDAIVDDMKSPVAQLCADGGAAANNFLLQFQADILNLPVKRPVMNEATALGAVYLASLGSGFFGDLPSLPEKPGTAVFSPGMEEKERERLLSGWKKAVGRVAGWEERGP